MGNIEIGKHYEYMPSMVITPDINERSVSFGQRRETMRTFALDSAVVLGAVVLTPVIIAGVIAKESAAAVADSIRSLA